MSSSRADLSGENLLSGLSLDFLANTGLSQKLRKLLAAVRRFHDLPSLTRLRQKWRRIQRQESPAGQP
jgi:hypothetical protein